MWYIKKPIYEIYIRSFKDSVGDGIGDIRGIISKLDYLKDLGIGSIWVTPFYESPKVDNGYDISNYEKVDPDFGELEDFKTLVKEAHNREIKIIIDVVLNHTSSEHEWFKKALSGDKYYKDFYVFAPEPLNNWKSFFNNDSWTYSYQVGEYYLHKFAPEQPDLNYENENVINEIFKMLRLWLDLGVDGLRLDVINFLQCTKENLYKDNPEGKQIYNINQPKIMEIITKLNCLKEEYKDLILIGEIGSEDVEVLSRYVGQDKLDFVFNFNVSSLKELNLKKLYNELKVSLEKFDYPTIFFSSHDMSRFYTRLAKEDVRIYKLLIVLILYMRGVPILFQGDEGALFDVHNTEIEDIVDIQARLTYEDSIRQGNSSKESLQKAIGSNRDYSRGPIMWEMGDYFGFSKAEPWMKFSQNIRVLENNEYVEFTKKIIKKRYENEVLQFGEVKDLTLVNGELIYFKRIHKEEKIEVFLNFSSSEQEYLGEVLQPYTYMER